MNWRASSRTSRATLSPIPDFGPWLERKLNEPGKDVEASWLTAVDRKALVAAGTGKEPVSLKTLLQTPGWHQKPELTKALKAPMLRLVARYLVKEKKRDSSTALDRVARFHLQWEHESSGSTGWPIPQITA